MSDRYQFIDSEKANYPVVRMCAWLEVSTSGFYEWARRAVSESRRRREHLKILIAAHFESSNQTYGYRRIRARLARQGEAVSAELVRALMRELDLRPCQPRPYRVTTRADPAGAASTPDLVGRDFTAAAPGQKLVADITFVKTWQGWLYVATVIDCHTKAVVGWAMAHHMKASLVTAALTMASTNVDILPGCVFHSDRGTQYTSVAYRSALAELGVRASVGRTGVCWDNALAESFFAALKNELTHRTVFATHNLAKREIVKYIEGFYNRTRLHSGLGYKTPLEVHTEYQNRRHAA